MFPFEEQAIQVHEMNVARAKEGIYDESVRKSYQALAELKPGRYGKTELMQDVVDDTQLDVAARCSRCAARSAHCGAARACSSAPCDACAEAPPARAAASRTRRRRPQTERRRARRRAHARLRRGRSRTPARRARPRSPSKFRARAAADFDRAVNLMRAGNATEAELEFKQLAAAYPQLAAPHINLGLLQRKAGKLDEAEATLAAAVDAQSGERRRVERAGRHAAHARQVPEAGAAPTSRRIAADPNFAPAHRNLACCSTCISAIPSARSPSSSATRSSPAKRSR